MKRISAFIMYETVIQIGSQYFWLWIVTEPIRKTILVMHSERNKQVCSSVSLDLWYQNMVIILYTLMMEHGNLHKPELV